MAYTFKKVLEGVSIGKSLFDQEGAELVAGIVAEAKKKNVKIHLPDDHVCANEFSNDANIKVVSDAEGVPDDYMALDVGPNSQKRFSEVMARAQTILWNG